MAQFQETVNVTLVRGFGLGIGTVVPGGGGEAAVDTQQETIMFKLSILRATIGISMLSITAGASAQLAYFDEYQQGPWSVLEVAGTEPCGSAEDGFGFDTHVVLYEKFKETEVSGRLILHFQGHASITNPKNGRTVEEQWNSKVIVDLRKGMIYNPGTPIHTTGEDGKFAVAAGRLVIDMSTGKVSRPYSGIQWPDVIAFPDPEDDYQRLICEELVD